MIDRKTHWQSAFVPLGATLLEIVQTLDEVAIKIVMVVDQDGILRGTISDGDIRRGLLRGLTLTDPITEVYRRTPLVVPESMSRELVLELMAANKIQQIPVVDDDWRPVGLHLWDEVATPVSRSNMMVIMAGGKGTRLGHRTQSCPKPLLPIEGKPMMEYIIQRAKDEGFCHFVLAINYLGHMIEDYFGDGDSFGVKIEYLKEDAPLGTAGALSLFEPRPDLPIVVTNGDVMTDIHYDELLDFHDRHDAVATMAVRQHDWQHPYGVVKMDGVEIVGFDEKPINRTHINAGVYALAPSALGELVKGASCDMPCLFERLQAKGLRTVAYPMHEPWLDVGRPEDLGRASEKISNQVERENETESDKAI